MTQIVKIKDSVLRQAAEEGMDAFVQVFVDAISEAVGGEMTAETFARLIVASSAEELLSKI